MLLKLSVVLKLHAMKMHRRHEGKIPYLLNHGTSGQLFGLATLTPASTM
jgi:hypothetical protein